jgi:hypothetical protein
VVDALNKKVHEMHATEISMYNSYLKRFFLEFMASDQHYVQVKEGLQQSNLQLKYKYYKMEEDGILLYMNTFGVPNSRELINLVLREMHNIHYARHLWYQKTIVVV